MDTNVGDRIRQLLTLAGRMDVTGIARYLAPDVVMELPYAPPPLPRRYDGLSTVLGFQRSSAALFSTFAIDIDRIHVVENGPVVIAEYRSHGVVAASGRSYANSYVTVFELDPGGRVRRWREYYDPNEVQTAFPDQSR
jgi:ketosteroid isomerase-like protein